MNSNSDSVMAKKVENTITEQLSGIFLDIVYSPLNLALLAICILFLYKIYVKRRPSPPVVPAEPELPRMKKQDLTLEQLKQYDGDGPQKRVLVAVNGKVFDVTKGRRFYGPGGPYSAFAGRDATRALATFAVDAVKDEYDDISDLNTMQMDSVREWEMQFSERYDYIGRLLKPGEEPNEYSDEEDQSQIEAKTEMPAGEGDRSKDE